MWTCNLEIYGLTLRWKIQKRDFRRGMLSAPNSPTQCAEAAASTALRRHLASIHPVHHCLWVCAQTQKQAHINVYSKIPLTVLRFHSIFHLVLFLFFGPLPWVFCSCLFAPPPHPILQPYCVLPLVVIALSAAWVFFTRLCSIPRSQSPRLVPTTLVYIFAAQKKCAKNTLGRFRIAESDLGES